MAGKDAAGRGPKAVLEVRLTPRSSKDGLAGWEGERLKVSVAAPPVDDQANKSLVKFLAKSLKVSPSAVSVERGKTSRLKTISISGLAQEELDERLNEALAESRAQAERRRAKAPKP